MTEQKLMYDDLKIDELCGDMADIAELVGIDDFLKLFSFFKGCTINFPKNSLNQYFKRKIMEEFDGSRRSIKKLAVKFDLSEGFVADLLKNNRIIAPVEGQMGLFTKEENAG